MNKKVSRRKEIKETILRLSEGVIANLIDFTLYTIFYGVNLTSQPYSSTITKKASAEAFKTLETINYEQIKNATRKLKERKLIAKNLAITELGKKKLSLLLPLRQKSKRWNKRWYLVIFDIPEKRRHDRHILRDWLKRTGFGKLQHSVWISPYNYTDKARRVGEELAIGQYVIISSTKGLGDDKAKIIAQKVWGLDKINQDYLDFIAGYENNDYIDKISASFRYLGILRRDPQLPDNLLPGNWAGEKAHLVYQKILQNTTKKYQIIVKNTK